MDNNAKRRKGFRLIQGGRMCEMSFGSIRIVAAPEKWPPFDIDALAVEEDTWLIMSAEPKICHPPEHPIRLMTDLLEAQPKTVGSVLVRGKHPLQFMAIIHDVNQEPTWREEWVQNALNEIFHEVAYRKLQALGLPMLGTVHGKLEKRRFATLLSRTLHQAPLGRLRRLWLIAPIPINTEIIRLLQPMLL
jgi:hypothetical protein